jgi:hypothetical protein
MSDDTKFAEWLKKVDEYMQSNYGSDHTLFEFYGYRADYDRGISPAHSAETAVMNNAQDVVYDELGENI